MTLRLRLVAAIFLLVTAGLVAFGVVTNALYAQSAYQRLDAQIRSLAPLIDQQLDIQAGRGVAGPAPEGGGGGGGGPGGPGGPGGSRGPSPVVPPGTYAELRSASGAVLVAPIPFGTGAAQPRLPATLPPPPANGRLFNVGTTSGSGGFRVLETPARDGGTTVIAVPSTEVTNAVRNLLLIEVAGSAALLVLLSAGSWLVLRRGLRPLERMAGQARSITAGDLSQRVSPAGGGSEVGQLGLALNTMLGDIEAAFAEREAIELRLRRFLADASHELRTPLTSIQGFAELFRISGEDAGVDLPTILRRIEQETARMKVLVEDLLLLARLDEPRTVARDPVDLAVLAADACSDAVATAPDRPITLVAAQPVVVAGDQVHLRQAIANLVTNAVRHTPSGTPIEVAARLGDGAAEISVRDHGTGLSEDALTHAFERFWQADRARVGPGAGLGLAIVASIAAEHGGRATAANAADGGAEFVITLPLSQASDPPPGAPGSARSGDDDRVPGGAQPAPRRR